MAELVFYFVVLLNIVTFCAFGLDKRRAKKGRSRIPEARLLGLSWAAGLIGGWAGMSVFRHKTSKTGFKVKMVLVSIANLLWPLIWFW